MVAESIDLDALVPIFIVVSIFSGLTTIAFVFTLYVWSPLTKSIRWLCNVGLVAWTKSAVSLSSFCKSGTTLLVAYWKFDCKGRTSYKLTPSTSSGTPDKPFAYVTGTVNVCDAAAPLPLNTQIPSTFVLLANLAELLPSGDPS